MPRRKDTEAEIRARAINYLARILFAKEHDIRIEDEIAAWEELNEQEQAHYREIASVAIVDMERDRQKKLMRVVTPEQQ